MWVCASSELSENVRLINTALSSHSLILGECAALVDSSVAPLVSDLSNQVKTALDEENLELTYLLLTHAHFDHLGGVSEIRKNFPGIKLVGGRATSILLSDEKYIEEMYRRNLECAKATNYQLALSLEEWRESLHIDVIVGDGDSLDLGAGVSIAVVATPGHTEDSISYFVKPDGALVVGEAFGGFHTRGVLTPCFMSDYEDYINSIEKLTSLEAKSICFAHSGAITGKIVNSVPVEARQVAEKFISDIGQRMSSGETSESIVNDIIAEWSSLGWCPDGPFAPSLEDAVKFMVASVERFN